MTLDLQAVTDVVRRYKAVDDPEAEWPSYAENVFATPLKLLAALRWWRGIGTPEEEEIDEQKD